jgi:hypothetical protein
VWVVVPHYQHLAWCADSFFTLTRQCHTNQLHHYHYHHYHYQLAMLVPKHKVTVSSMYSYLTLFTASESICTCSVSLVIQIQCNHRPLTSTQSLVTQGEDLVACDFNQRSDPFYVAKWLGPGDNSPEFTSPVCEGREREREFTCQAELSHRPESKPEPEPLYDFSPFCVSVHLRIV